MRSIRMPNCGQYVCGDAVKTHAELWSVRMWTPPCIHSLLTATHTAHADVSISTNTLDAVSNLDHTPPDSLALAG